MLDVHKSSPPQPGDPESSAPWFNAEHFKCLSCAHTADQSWFACFHDGLKLYTIDGLSVSRCSHCGNLAIWVAKDLVWPFAKADGAGFSAEEEPLRPVSYFAPDELERLWSKEKAEKERQGQEDLFYYHLEALLDQYLNWVSDLTYRRIQQFVRRLPWSWEMLAKQDLPSGLRKSLENDWSAAYSTLRYDIARAAVGAGIRPPTRLSSIWKVLSGHVKPHPFLRNAPPPVKLPWLKLLLYGGVVFALLIAVDLWLNISAETMNALYGAAFPAVFLTFGLSACKAAITKSAYAYGDDAVKTLEAKKAGALKAIFGMVTTSRDADRRTPVLHRSHTVRR